MKHKILLLLLIFSSLIIRSQVSEPCLIKNISTNPANPTTQHLSNGDILRILDWMQYNWQWQIGNNPGPIYNIMDIINPYSSVNNVNVDHLLTTGIDDFMPEDGWELMSYNDGTRYESSAPIVRNDITFPKLILYNKYRGILRVFLYYNRDVSEIDDLYNAGFLKLEFDDPKNTSYGIQSANLTSFNPEYRAIDAFPKEQKAGVANKLSAELYDWLYADFPMAYDPCVCEFTYDKLKISVNLIDQADIQLNGNITTSDLLKTQSGNTTIFDPTKGIAAGTEIGKDVSKALKVYKDDKELLANLFAALGNQVKGGTAKKDSLKKTNSPGNQALKTLADLATKNLPYLGFALSLIDNLTADSKPSAPTSMSFKAGVDLTGTITTKEESATIAYFKVPGSVEPRNGYDDLYRAIYDEPMGVINLMETPELEYVDYYGDVNSLVVWQRSTIANNYIPIIRQYKVKNMPKVAINPASGLVLEDIRYTIRVNYKGSKQFMYDPGNVINGFTQFPSLKPQRFHDRNNVYEITNTTFNDRAIIFPPYPVLEFGNQFNNNASHMTDDLVNKNGWGYENWPSSFPDTASGIMNTHYLPYSWYSNQTFYLYSGVRSYSLPLQTPEDKVDAPLDLYVPKFELKIVAVFRRVNDPNSEQIIHILSYPMKVVESQENKDGNGTPTCSLNITNNSGWQSFERNSPHGNSPIWPDPLRLPFDLKLENTSIGPGVVQALNNVYIGNNVTIAPGTNIYAGNAIEITGSTVDIPPTAVLEIRVPVGVTPINPADYLITDVSEYCHDANKYNPQVENMGYPDKGDNSTDQESRLKSSLQNDLTIYPNPANTYLKIRGDKTGEIDHIVLRDMMGRVITVWDNNFDLNHLELPEISSGSYFITIYSNDESHSEITKKISILKW